MSDIARVETEKNRPPKFFKFLNFVPWKTQLPQVLNICIVARRFPISGRGDSGYLWPIARGIAKKGHKVTVITQAGHQRTGELSIEGVRLIHISTEDLDLSDFSILALVQFEKLHHANPFHIVHAVDTSALIIAEKREALNFSIAFDVAATQMSQLFSIAGMAQESLGSLIATSVAVAYKFLRTYYRVDRKIIRLADGIFVMSPHERNILERYYLYPDLSIYSLPYGIELGGLETVPPQDFKQKLKIPAGGKIALTYSDMMEIKVVTNLLEAFERVAVKNSGARLIILGTGPKFKEIEYEMLSLALGSRVILPGSATNQEISDYIAICDTFIQLSSRTTGFEPMILEAMVQKKIVIGSEVSPLSSLIDDGVDGFLVRPADIKSISELLDDVFSERIPVGELGEHAHRKITSLFDTAKMVDETLKAYFNILHKTQRFAKQVKTQK